MFQIRREICASNASCNRVRRSGARRKSRFRHFYGARPLTWPAFVLWFLMLAAFLSRGPSLVYLLNSVCIFGTLQMIPGDVGGVNLVPQSVCGAFLVAKVFLQRGNLVRGFEVAANPGRIGLLTAFLAYGLLSALVLPRLFAGQIEVTPVAAYASGTSLVGPTSGNITQSCYLTLSYAIALCFALIGQREDFQKHFLVSLLAGASALIASGVIDLICYRFGLTGLLDPLRTASYALLTDVEAEGAKRVVGFMAEASVYGSTCVNFLAVLAFLRPLFPRALQPLVVITLFALITMIALSTSSGAYVGFAVFLVVYALDLLIRMRSPLAILQDGALLEIGLLAGALFIFLVIFFASPHLFDAALGMIDKMVFQKSYSASYVERSAWTRVGWQAFLDTGGLGVGIGSLRTSNWFVSILGSTGIFGSMLMFGFIIRLYTFKVRKGDARAMIWTRALRFALIPGLVMDGLGGTIPDIGIMMASLFGILAGMPEPYSETPPLAHRPILNRSGLHASAE
jgi:hypothetical protein